MNVEYADEESGMNPGELGLHTAIVSHTQVSNYQWRTQAWTTIIKNFKSLFLCKMLQAGCNGSDKFVVNKYQTFRKNFVFTFPFLIPYISFVFIFFYINFQNMSESCLCIYFHFHLFSSSTKCIYRRPSAPNSYTFCSQPLNLLLPTPTPSAPNP